MTALMKAEPDSLTFGFERPQVDLIKTTIAKGCTDDELRLFLLTSQRLQLDPFAKQIYAVKRWDSRAGREVMSIQVGIDGLRSVADRTGFYAPGGDYAFEYDDKGQLIKATATVRKYVHGTWHETQRSAHWKEYVQTTKDGKPTAMWRDKPHVMLGKCAEAQALRAAFPQLGGAYIPEEMQADQPAPVEEYRPPAYEDPKLVKALEASVQATAPQVTHGPVPVTDDWAERLAERTAQAKKVFEGAKEVNFPMDSSEREAMYQEELRKKNINKDELHGIANKLYPGDSKEAKEVRKTFYARFGLVKVNPIKQFLELDLEKQDYVLEDAREFAARVESDLKF